jgi:leucyl/phenylalanyl-tRNA---protein transferase
MELTPQLLLHAYSLGIFPMAEGKDDPDVVWMEPKQRGVIPLDAFHISKSLSKAIAKNDYQIRLNNDFEAVVDACAERDETWINATIRQGYMRLFDVGHAHSIEVWRDDNLIGGVYGVSLGAAFFGESMFSRETNGSKIALAYLVAHLRKCGFMLCDTQYLTEHLASLGAVEIERDEYIERLNLAVQAPESFQRYSEPPSAFETLQRNNQTS